MENGKKNGSVVLPSMDTIIGKYLNTKFRDFPGGAVVKTVLPMQGAWVQSLVWELDPTGMPQLRVHMTQLRRLPATTKTQCNQPNK